MVREPPNLNDLNALTLIGSDCSLICAQALSCSSGLRGPPFFGGLMYFLKASAPSVCLPILFLQIGYSDFDD